MAKLPPPMKVRSERPVRVYVVGSLQEASSGDRDAQLKERLESIGRALATQGYELHFVTNYKDSIECYILAGALSFLKSPSRNRAKPSSNRKPLVLWEFDEDEKKNENSFDPVFQKVLGTSYAKTKPDLTYHRDHLNCSFTFGLYAVCSKADVIFLVGGKEHSENVVRFLKAIDKPLFPLTRLLGVDTRYDLYKTHEDYFKAWSSKAFTNQEHALSTWAHDSPSLLASGVRNLFPAEVIRNPSPMRSRCILALLLGFAIAGVPALQLLKLRYHSATIFDLWTADLLGVDETDKVSQLWLAFPMVSGSVLGVLLSSTLSAEKATDSTNQAENMLRKEHELPSVTIDVIDGVLTGTSIVFALGVMGVGGLTKAFESGFTIESVSAKIYLFRYIICFTIGCLVGAMFDFPVPKHKKTLAKLLKLKLG